MCVIREEKTHPALHGFYEACTCRTERKKEEREEEEDEEEGGGFRFWRCLGN